MPEPNTYAMDTELQSSHQAPRRHLDFFTRRWQELSFLEQSTPLDTEKNGLLLAGGEAVG